mgnify:CR=1 FL=1
MPPTNDQEPADGRRARIEQVVREALAAWEAGVEPDDPQFIRCHPELMPELGERLQTARLIFLARKQSVASERDPASEENDPENQRDLRLLRDHFKGFKILSRIEQGGQGVVFKAIQLSTGRTVALKVLNDGPFSTSLQRERFAREVALIARLQHPNIVTIYESGVVDGRPYFAMEFVDGLPIDDYLLCEGPTVRECVRLLLPVCQAVAHAHQKGIIHRDLKPFNILVDFEGRPRILDFGLAKNIELADTEGRSMLSMAWQVVGTLEYMSPEQVRGATDEVDVLSDIYSLGVILYRLLTGRFPYPVVGDYEDIRRSILDEEPMVPSRALRGLNSAGRSTVGPIEGDLDRILLKALEKDKDRRYQSATALAEDLERYLAGEPVQARAASNLYILRKTVRRYRIQFAAAAVIAATLTVASIVTTYYAFRAARERDQARAVAAFAHSLFDEVATTIEEDMSVLAGGSAVRDAHLHSLASRLVTLQELVEADSEMQDLKLKIYEKRGDIAATQGKYADAREHYEQVLSLALGNQQNRRGQQAQDASVAQASSPANVRASTSDLSSAGVLGPFASLPFSPAASAPLEALRLHLRIRTKLGCLKEDDQFDQFEEGLRVGRMLVSRLPDDRHVHRDQGKLLVWMATACVNNGRADDALRVLDVAERLGTLAVLEKLEESTAQPAGIPNPTGQRQNAKAEEPVPSHDAPRTGSAVLAASSQRPQAATEDVGLHGRARSGEVRERFADQEVLAAYYAIRGRARAAMGMAAECIADLETGLALRRRLSEAHPTNVLLMHEYRLSCINAANAYSDLLELAIAENHLKEAVRIGEYLLSVEPDIPHWRRELVRTCNRMVRVLIDEGRYDEAEEYATRSKRLAQVLLESQEFIPGDLDYMAGAHHSMATIHAVRKEWERAFEEQEAARLLQVRLLEIEPDNYLVARSLGGSLDRLGQYASMLESPQAALAYYLDAFEVRQELARLNPEPSARQVSILASINKFTIWHISRKTEADDEAAGFWIRETEHLLGEFCRSRKAETKWKDYQSLEHALNVNRRIVEKRIASRLLAKRETSASSEQPE